MTSTAVKGAVYYPPQYHFGSSVFLEPMTLDAAGEKAAVIFPIPVDGTIIGGSFTTLAVSVTAGPLDFTVTLETVDSSGDPSGTLYHANATVTQAIATTDDNKQFDFTWTGFTGNAGDIVALVVTAPGSGTFDVDIAKGSGLLSNAFPYVDHFTTGWVKDNEIGIVALEYSGGIYHFISGCLPMATLVVTAFNNTDTPDEIGLKFQFPVPVLIIGGLFAGDLDNAHDVVLYDSSDTAQLTFSMLPANRATVQFSQYQFTFDGSFELAANTVARLVVKPTTALNTDVVHFTANTAAHLDAFPGGSDFHGTSRTDGGAWTDTLTNIPDMGLILGGIGEAAGGGAASILGGGSLHGDFG